MIKKILKVCLIILVAYFLLVLNTAIVGLIYIKVNPSYAESKVPFPLGIIGAILVAIEFYVFHRYKSIKKQK